MAGMSFHHVPLTQKTPMWPAGMGHSAAELSHSATSDLPLGGHPAPLVPTTGLLDGHIVGGDHATYQTNFDSASGLVVRDESKGDKPITIKIHCRYNTRCDLNRGPAVQLFSMVPLEQELESYKASLRLKTILQDSIYLMTATLQELRLAFLTARRPGNTAEKAATTIQSSRFQPYFDWRRPTYQPLEHMASLFKFRGIVVADETADSASGAPHPGTYFPDNETAYGCGVAVRNLMRTCHNEWGTDIRNGTHLWHILYYRFDSTLYTRAWPLANVIKCIRDRATFTRTTKDASVGYVEPGVDREKITVEDDSENEYIMFENANEAIQAIEDHRRMASSPKKIGEEGARLADVIVARAVVAQAHLRVAFTPFARVGCPHPTDWEHFDEVFRPLGLNCAILHVGLCVVEPDIPGVYARGGRTPYPTQDDQVHSMMRVRDGIFSDHDRPGHMIQLPGEFPTHRLRYSSDTPSNEGFIGVDLEGNPDFMII